MLSSAVHNCRQTGVRPPLQTCLYSTLVPTRLPIIPLACESLCNFGEIYTKTYRTASFFSPSPSPSPPFLTLPRWRNSLLPQWHHSLHSTSGCWPHPLGLSPAFSVGLLVCRYRETTCKFNLNCKLLKSPFNCLSTTNKKSTVAALIQSSITLLKQFISVLEAMKSCTDYEREWQAMMSLQSAEEGKEASVRRWMSQELLDLSIKLIKYVL